MNGWILTYFCLNFLGLGIHLAKHGQPRNDKYSFFIALTSMSIAVGLLYMGGAFG